MKIGDAILCLLAILIALFFVVSAFVINDISHNDMPITTMPGGND